MGFNVAADYYYDLYEWIAAGQAFDYDLSYGGQSYTWDIDNIFQLAWFAFILNDHMFYHDDADLDAISLSLWDMMNAAMVDPTIATEEYINEMIDIFNQWETILWFKKYLLPFVQWEAPLNYGPFVFPAAKYTEVIVLKSGDGRVFSNIFYRWILSSIIDRSVFLDYHAAYNPYETYPVYHLFQESIYHSDLPDW